MRPCLFNFRVAMFAKQEYFITTFQRPNTDIVFMTFETPNLTLEGTCTESDGQPKKI